MKMKKINMKNETLVTSSGIIKNRSVPRVGVISANSELLDYDVINDLLDINNVIDISFEDFLLELKNQIECELDDCDLDPETKLSEIDRLVDERLETELLEPGPNFLIGDAWLFNKETKSYEIDKTKELAATFNSESNIICVEWSKFTRSCHHTSPCYVMSNGNGPCGDLNTEGDAVIAYDLPSEFYKND
jgi:hypothetical protein